MSDRDRFGPVGCHFCEPMMEVRIEGLWHYHDDCEADQAKENATKDKRIADLEGGIREWLEHLDTSGGRYFDGEPGALMVLLDIPTPTELAVDRMYSKRAAKETNDG